MADYRVYESAVTLYGREYRADAEALQRAARDGDPAAVGRDWTRIALRAERRAHGLAEPYQQTIYRNPVARRQCFHELLFSLIGIDRIHPSCSIGDSVYVRVDTDRGEAEGPIQNEIRGLASDTGQREQQIL